MLKRREYRYLTWKTNGDKCEFTFNVEKMPEDTVCENCFYSTNKFLQNLRNYCEWNGIEMPKNQLEAAMQLLGKEYNCREIRQVVECLVNKNEEKMRAMTNDPIRLTTPILQKFGENVQEINRFYGQTRDIDEEYR